MSKVNLKKIAGEASKVQSKLSSFFTSPAKKDDAGSDATPTPAAAPAPSKPASVVPSKADKEKKETKKRKRDDSPEPRPVEEFTSPTSTEVKSAGKRVSPKTDDVTEEAPRKKPRHGGRIIVEDDDEILPDSAPAASRVIVDDDEDFAEPMEVSAPAPETPKESPKAPSFDSVDEALRNMKQDPKLHAAFVKKLASMDTGDDRDSRFQARRADESKKKRKDEYTPLERQVLKLKADYPGTLLCIAVGYKYRFFGDDAEIAGRVCHLVSWQDRHFMTCSLPLHRMHHHVLKLVKAGYKVGIVDQMESAAMKAASDNKSGPFDRQLTKLFTTTTMVDAEMEVLEGQQTAQPPVSSSYLMCFFEHEGNTVAPLVVAEEGLEVNVDRNLSSERVTISMVAVQLTTGDVVYDEFVDDFMRTGLETRVAHLDVREVVTPSKISHQSEKVLRALVRPSNREEDDIRMERRPPAEFAHDTASETVHDCFGAKILEQIQKMPKGVVSCIGVLCQYLNDFKLNAVLKLITNFAPFATRYSMVLNGPTMDALEILDTPGTNEISARGGKVGTLLWSMDNTMTQFGRRQFKKWVSLPLMDRHEIEERAETVDELINSASPVIPAVKVLLQRLPDLERGLIRASYKKCEPKEFVKVLKAFERIQRGMPSATSCAAELKTPLLRRLIVDMPRVDEPLAAFMGMINEEAAEREILADVLRSEELYPDLPLRKARVKEVNADFRQHLTECRTILHMPDLDWKSVQPHTHLIDVPNAKLKLVPDDWIQMSVVKASKRYHTPRALVCLRELALAEEHLQLAARAAWNDFLGRFGECYSEFRAVVRNLATLDCLFSLAQVASKPGYVRPRFIDAPSSKLNIQEGRHPVVEQLVKEGYVPNDVALDGDGERCLILTGPNMGGKSSYIKQVALTVIMAQIGSYVPAASAELTVFDGIYARMGASDDISKGQSTFFVELMEASQIIARATSRSLVILDELGRGTSTHDGVAIAYATLDYAINTIKCATLFVTHYPSLCELVQVHPQHVVAHHMSFMEGPAGDDGLASVVFLYTATRGVVTNSYGLNVARLASIPATIVKRAGQKSKEMALDLENGLQGGAAPTELAKAANQLLAATRMLLSAQQAGEAIDDTAARRQLVAARKSVQLALGFSSMH